METRKERINAQIKRNKKYHHRQKVKKFGKLSIFTGTTLGLSGIFTQVGNTKATPSSMDNESVNTNQIASNPAPNSSYNFTQDALQVSYLTQNQYNFLSQIAPIAQKLASENNLYASVMLAQAIIESGWGQSGLASAPNYNLFGVKGSYLGNSVSMPTQEQTSNGETYSIVADFAKYPNYEASMKAYIQTMLNPLYVGSWRSNTRNYQDAANYLTGRYATAINYGDTLISTIQKYNLTIFDSKDFSVNPQLKGVAFPLKQQQTYIIQKGDSLWGIARKHGVSLNEILKLNHLQLNSKIYPHQILKLREISPVSNIPFYKIVKNQSIDATNKPELPLSSESNEQYLKNELKNSYTVKAGDSLYAIAKKNGLSLADLLRINNLNVNSIIKPGDVLKIQDFLNSKSNAALNVSEDGSYLVKKYDSLYRIAINSGLSLNELLNLNHLKANSLIYPGQKLIVKSKTKTVIPSTPKTNNTNLTKYKVKVGDTLYHIARQAGISLDELLNLNHLKINSLILPGQELIIKKSVADNQNNHKVPFPSLDNKDFDQHKSSIYTVKAGDTLYHIAQEFKINLSDLLETNHLNEKSLITPGQKLLISSPSKVNQQKANKDQPSKVEVSEKETNETNTYQVVKGDTFYSISKKFGITIDELLNANNLSLNSVVNPGKKLIINKSASETLTSSDVESNKKSGSKIEDSKTVAEVDQKTYTVKQGDSLYKIATSHKTTVNALEKINELPGDLIIPGQVIRIK